MTAKQADYSKLDQPEILGAIFHPRKSLDSPPPEGAVDHGIQVDEGIRLGARFYLGDSAGPNILFFHGNGEIVADYDPFGPLYAEQGLNLLAVDYRGYGKSGGSPTVSNMMSDAHIVLEDVRGWLNGAGHTGPLIIMGRSLGSAPALELAATYPDEIAGLIIESGFATSLPLLVNLGIDVHAQGLTEEDGFNNIRKIEKFTKPTLIIHAQNDQIIPVDNIWLLHAQCAARHKDLQIVPNADHNTIILQTGRMYFEAIKRFTYKITGNKPRWKKRKR